MSNDRARRIRSYTWLNGSTSLSWVYVMERLGFAFEDLGHKFYPISTNGYEKSAFSQEKVLQSVQELDQLKRKKVPIDLDLCYTVPLNFPQRFLRSSKHKAAIYNYETFHPTKIGWPAEWKKYYNLVDYYFPSSNFSAEIFYQNGIPKEKIFVIPHGVDQKRFNPEIPPVKLKTKKKTKFVAVVAPHYRKNIDTLLEAYCRAFTAQDDVCLVLKTKIYKHSDGIYDAQKNPGGRKPFEIVMADIFKELVKKYGRNLPEIELLGGYVENVASIYTAGSICITTTGAEGYNMPSLEALSCGLISIAPRYSGHLDYLNDKNALLINTKLRKAKRFEQYWSYTPGSLIGQPDVDHTAELMRYAAENKERLLEEFGPKMKKTVDGLSWTSAAQKILDVCDGKIEHYKPGTYDLMNEHKK